VFGVFGAVTLLPLRAARTGHFWPLVSQQIFANTKPLILLGGKHTEQFLLLTVS
jgi:hypothetical protein